MNRLAVTPRCENGPRFREKYCFFIAGLGKNSAHRHSMEWAALQMIHASIAHAGRVKTQARTILPATPHLTAESLLVAPTPIIVEEMIWVVERGSPIREAASITVAAEASAANPWIGCR